MSKITSGNAHLSRAVQIFNTLNSRLVAEERRRNFDYDGFADQSVLFGEDLISAASFYSEAVVQDSLVTTARTLCTASLQLVDAVARPISDISEAREIWSKVVTRSVQVLKEVLALVAKRS